MAYLATPIASGPLVKRLMMEVGTLGMLREGTSSPKVQDAQLIHMLHRKRRKCPRWALNVRPTIRPLPDRRRLGRDTQVISPPNNFTALRLHNRVTLYRIAGADRPTSSQSLLEKDSFYPISGINEECHHRNMSGISKVISPSPYSQSKMSRFQTRTLSIRVWPGSSHRSIHRRRANQ